MLLLPTAFSLAAATPVTITSEDVRGNVGDTVTATLNIVVEPPKLGQTMDSLQFELEYDSAALEFVSIQEVYQDRINILGAQYMCSVTEKTGAVAFAAAASDGSSGSGVLMHVKFRVLSAVSTMLVLKKVAYSFVSKNGSSQDRRQGGTVNLGRVTGQSVPTTIAPSSPVPGATEPPAGTSLPTDEPRFPVTEVTNAPGTSPTPQPEKEENDILAYLVFGLFIVVAILICVVVTLMIVRRGRNRSRTDYLEDDDDDGSESLLSPDEDETYGNGRSHRPNDYDDDDDEPPIRIVRKGKK